MSRLTAPGVALALLAAIMFAVLLDSPASGQQLPPASEEAQDIEFVLRGVVVEGSTVYRDADFLPLYQSLLRKEVSLADIQRIADAITARYRRDGYILSQAIVPPQTILGGPDD